MNNCVTIILDELSNIFKTTDEILNSWTQGFLQIPVLVNLISKKMNFSEEKSRKIDPIVRYYLHVHPDWFVSRGVKGGVMPMSIKQQKDALKANKIQLKEQLKSAIEAKLAVAAKTHTASSTEINDNDIDDLEDSLDDDSDDNS